MKRIAAAAAFILLFTVAASPRATIAAPDGLHFGDIVDASSIDVTPPAHYRGGLWGEIVCQPDTGSQAVGWINLDDTSPQDQVTLGPAPSWTAGHASCAITLWSLSGIYPDHVYATDSFEVLP